MKIRLRSNRAASRTESKAPRDPKRPRAAELIHDPLAHLPKYDVLNGLGYSPEDLRHVLAQLEQSVWRNDPALWIQERCNEHVWSKQVEICNSVVQNRKTVVRSCHGSGKSFLAARLAAWWLSTHEPGKAFVVSSAPTGRQVRTILWREIGRVHAKAKLPGRTNQTEWHMEMPEGNEEIVAFGMKPDDMSPTAFQGIHARYVLIIFDEACGIAPALWDAADSLAANDDSRMLAIGNPDDPETEFHEVSKPGSGWHAIRISAFDTPNFTGEVVPDELKHLLVGHLWVEEKLKKWGEENPLYISKVLGEFPELTEDGLIPIKWIRQAQERDLKPGTPSELGCDIGGGTDPNIIAHRRGYRVRIIRKDVEPDTMKTCGNIVKALRETQADCAKVDIIGIGRGVVNRGKELGKPFVGINVSMKPSKHRGNIHRHDKKPPEEQQEFANLRAEGFWGLRTLFQDGNIDIDQADDDLAAELAALKYEPNSSGLIQIIKKKKLKEELGRSPNEADAVMLAFLNPALGRKYKATWGHRLKDKKNQAA